MASSPWPSRLRLFLLGVLCAMPLACMQVVVNKSTREGPASAGAGVTTNKFQLIVAAAQMCPVGSAGCPCTSGGGCDPGLWCDNGTCVGDYGGDEEYMFEDDMLEVAAEPEPVSRSVSLPGRAGRSKGRFNRRADRSVASPPPAPSVAEAEMAGSAGLGVDVAEVAAESSEPQDPAGDIDHGRQIIYTAALQVAVYDLDAAAELAESLPGRYGGWIESRYDYQITLRITAEHLFEAIEELSALGIVLDKALYAQDVTAEYIDLESRIRVLEQLVMHLEDMLKMAKTVEEMLKIRAALDAARLELASAQARMRELSESIDFSTLTLILTLRGPAELFPSSNDPFPWVESLGVELTEYR